MNLSLPTNQLDIIYLLAQSIDLVPGFQHAYSFYYHPIYNNVKLAHANNSGISDVSNFSDGLSATINKLRKSSQQIEWVDESEIPFTKQNIRTEIQKQVFDELKHHILLFRLKSKYDNSYDLLYIFFKADASNFGIKKSEATLTTDQKSIISTLVKRTFDIFLKQQANSLKKQELFRNDINLLQSQLKSNRSNDDIDAYKNQIYTHIHSIFKSKTQQIGFTIQLDKQVQQLIYDFKGKISDIEQNTENCINMAIRAQNPIFGGILHIDEFVYNANFNFITEEDTKLKEVSYTDNRKQKSAHFLNNLENAARFIQSKGDNITGTNVGLAMEKPISAPAISEYLKKYRKPLQQLCNENPEQWVLIRKSFTPLKNILSA